MPMIVVRLATTEDAESIATLIRELALYERLEGEARPNVAALRKELAAETKPQFLVATVDGQLAGYAVSFPHYGTFCTRWVRYLEDLFVREEYRGYGVGKALLAHVAQLALQEGQDRLFFSVLGWNGKAKAFYRRHGAQRADGWETHHFGTEALEELARYVV